MSYKVHITDAALEDMKTIYRYIADQLGAPETALAQYNRIADAILSLEMMPERYPLFLSEPERAMRLRKLAVDNYLVVYVVDAEIVTVTDVLYGASDLQRKLAERH